MSRLAVRRSTIFEWLWIGLFICHVYAFSYSGEPNQVFWSYAAVFAMYGVTLCWRSKFVLWSLSRLVALYFLYLLAFYIVGFWELIPGTTARHLPFLSLYWLFFVAYFAAGFRLTTAQIISVHVILAWLVIAYTVGQWVLTPDVTRFGYGQLAMLLLAVLVAYDRVMAAILLAVVMAGSNSITTLVAGLAGVISYLLVYYKGNVVRFVVEQRRFMLALFFAPVALSLSLPHLISTFSRFQTLGDDFVRAYIVEYSTRMLRESKFMGIGYMNFYAWSGIDTGYAAEGRTGAEILGFNLHNSYMTWALEGGVLVCLVVVLIIWLTMRRLQAIIAADRRLGAVIFSWFIALGIVGLFHQVHMSIEFWGAIGLVWGIHAQLAYGKRQQAKIAIRKDNLATASPS